MYCNRTFEYNLTSVTHALIEFQNTVTITKQGKNYIPRAGYPGTLAPGETFEHYRPFSALPKKILHPFGAMIILPPYRRSPPTHPHISSSTIMMARDGKFSINKVMDEYGFDKVVPSSDEDEIFGGYDMDSRDVARIALFCRHGRSFDPNIQIKHPGLSTQHDFANELPFYRAEHGPTMSEEECEHEYDEALEGFYKVKFLLLS
jgi:hypothetical protein